MSICYKDRESLKLEKLNTRRNLKELKTNNCNYLREFLINEINELNLENSNNVFFKTPKDLFNPYYNYNKFIE